LEPPILRTGRPPRHRLSVSWLARSSPPAPLRAQRPPARAGSFPALLKPPTVTSRIAAFGAELTATGTTRWSARRATADALGRFSRMPLMCRDLVQPNPALCHNTHQASRHRFKPAMRQCRFQHPAEMNSRIVQSPRERNNPGHGDQQRPRGRYRASGRRARLCGVGRHGRCRHRPGL